MWYAFKVKSHIIVVTKNPINSIKKQRQLKEIAFEWGLDTSAPTTSAPTTSTPFGKDTSAPRHDTSAPHKKTLRPLAKTLRPLAKDTSAPNFTGATTSAPW